MRLIFAAVAAVSMLGCAAAKGEQAKLTVPAGTPLAVRSGSPTSMRVGAPIRGALIYAVYAENQLVLPEGTVVHGTVTALTPDSTTRFHARLRGDFTPFRTPVVHFDSLEMGDGDRWSADVSGGGFSAEEGWVRAAAVRQCQVNCQRPHCGSDGPGQG